MQYNNLQNNLFGSTICKICAKCLKQQFENSKRKLCKMITYKLICPDQEYAKFVQNVYNSNLKNLDEKLSGTITYKIICWINNIQNLPQKCQNPQFANNLELWTFLKSVNCQSQLMNLELIQWPWSKHPISMIGRKGT